MSEQLSMFESGDSQPKPQLETQTIEADKSATSDVEHEYEDLDCQLAKLIIELNDYSPDDENEKKALEKTLRDCTLQISKHTREGQIAKAITKEQESVLLQTTVAGKAGDYKPLIIDAGYLYLNRYWQYQQRLAKQINERIEAKVELSQAQLQWANTRLDRYFDENSEASHTETNWQKHAVAQAIKHNFLIVSGGPGTGKTTTITRLLALLIEQYIHHKDDADAENTEKKWGGVDQTRFNILLAAPTGKAAIRMLDSIREASNALKTKLNLDDAFMDFLPTEANTIHKLLGYKHNSAQFKHNKNNPLHADVVLIDEASMVDVAMMSKLVDAVPEHAKLILIGDKDQLASVETGSVFADMCEGLDGSENLVTLKKNWRFAADSDIGQAAIAANQGDSQTLLSIVNDTSRTQAQLVTPNQSRDSELIKPWSAYFAVLKNPNATVEAIFSAFNQYRVLCALRRGFNGSDVMNERIETALQKKGLIEPHRTTTQNQSSHWYHGKPVMISQNSYKHGLMNGDTGIALIENNQVDVYFPSGSGAADYQRFSPVRLPAYHTAWSMTIHKSQGSEFDQVALILPQEEMPLLTKQLIYTGITRAKQSVSIVASEAVLAAGLRSEVSRATMITEYLRT